MCETIIETFVVVIWNRRLLIIVFINSAMETYFTRNLALIHREIIGCVRFKIKKMLQIIAVSDLKQKDPLLHQTNKESYINRIKVSKGGFTSKGDHFRPARGRESKVINLM